MYGQTSSPDVSKQCLDLVILYMIGTLSADTGNTTVTNGSFFLINDS